MYGFPTYAARKTRNITFRTNGSAPVSFSGNRSAPDARSKQQTEMYAILTAAVAALILGTTGGMKAATAVPAAVHASGTEQKQEPAPELSFDRMEHDFGTLRFKGEPQTAVFVFTNTGSAPLVITRTEQSCTCLSVKYPRKPLMPGESSTFEITYNPKNETGPFNNNVKIYSNTGNSRPVAVFVRGEVVK